MNYFQKEEALLEKNISITKFVKSFFDQYQEGFISSIFLLLLQKIFMKYMNILSNNKAAYLDEYLRIDCEGLTKIDAKLKLDSADIYSMQRLLELSAQTYNLKKEEINNFFSK